MSTYSWENLKGVNSGIIVYIDEKGYEVIELMSGKFDQKLDDPPIDKNNALRKLISATISTKQPFCKWSNIFKAILTDPGFHPVGKGLAILALAKIDTPDAQNYLRSLMDDKSFDAYGDLARALYLKEDSSGLDRLKSIQNNTQTYTAAMRKAALSWAVQGKWCPSMDGHGLCVQGLRAEYCGMMSYPYDKEKKVATSNTMKLPANTNYLYCPVYQSKGIYP
jgi:hypothetical protein